MFPPGFAARSFGFATTAHCLEETALPAETHCSGQGLVDDTAAVLVGVEVHALLFVQPDTVFGWHRTSLELYWT